MRDITFDSDGWSPQARGIYYFDKSFGPFTKKVRFVVQHGTASPGQTGDQIANDWRLYPGEASAHFLINKDGSFVQGISILWSAWGNCCITDNPAHGLYHSPALAGGNENFETVSIENDKFDGQYNSDALTPAQQETNFWLTKAILDFHSIPYAVIGIDDISNGGVIGHRNIDALNRFYCPGTYPWNDLSNFLHGDPHKSLEGGEMFTSNSRDFGKYFKVLKNGFWQRLDAQFILGGGFQTLYSKLSFDGQTLPITGLITSNEIGWKRNGKNGTVQFLERAVFVYDPSHEIDSQPGMSDCYLGHLDDEFIQSLKPQK